MILAAFIGAVLFVGQRYGVRHSSPVTFFTMMLAIDWVIFAGMTLYRGSGVSRAQTTPHLLSIVVLTGMAWGVGLTCLYASYNYTLALYAGSVMQVQMLVSITLGALLFKEGQYLQRMSAGLLMICGVLLVSWSAR
jgi:drug/metabolite transporter (DMT)-like permease